MYRGSQGSFGGFLKGFLGFFSREFWCFVDLYRGSQGVSEGFLGGFWGVFRGILGFFRG